MSNDQEEEILNFDKPSFVFTPNENHEWRQQGPYLVCKGCEIVHAQYIGLNKIMVGLTEEGKPILKKR